MDYAPEGLVAEGVLAISRHVFATAHITSTGDDLSIDTTNKEVSTDSQSFAFGYYSPINSKTDWFSSIGYLKGSTEFGGNNSEIDSDGYVLKVGARSMLYPDMELNWAIIHQDISIDGIDTNEAETGYELGAHINFTQQVDIGLGYRSVNDIDTITLGFRFRFK